MSHLMGHARAIRVLAVSGSLRRVSANTALVEAVARLAPPHVDVRIFRELPSIPPFNPDLDSEPPPDPIGRFRSVLAGCDGLLISSPEYAHGVPGVLKNALDWVVASGELIDKPVAVINASARAMHAWTALVEILTTMSARVIREASSTIPLDGTRLDAAGLAADPQLAASLRASLDALARATRIADGHSARNASSGGTDVARRAGR